MRRARRRSTRGSFHARLARHCPVARRQEGEDATWASRCAEEQSRGHCGPACPGACRSRAPTGGGRGVRSWVWLRGPASPPSYRPQHHADAPPWRFPDLGSILHRSHHRTYLCVRSLRCFAEIHPLQCDSCARLRLVCLVWPSYGATETKCTECEEGKRPCTHFRLFLFEGVLRSESPLLFGPPVSLTRPSPV